MDEKKRGKLALVQDTIEPEKSSCIVHYVVFEICPGVGVHSVADNSLVSSRGRVDRQFTSTLFSYSISCYLMCLVVFCFNPTEFWCV